VALGNFVEVDPEFAEVIHPLVVEVKGKKPRVCVDMRPSNSHLPGLKFRQEMLAKVGLDVVKPDSHLLVADLKSAYYSVQMRQEARPWNCFAWESLGPWFFTKLPKLGRPILGFLRTIGVSCTAYVDDFLASVDPADSAAVGPQLKKLLLDLGWKVSPKLELEGATTKTFTGFSIDTKAMTYTVSQAARARGPSAGARGFCGALQAAAEDRRQPRRDPPGGEACPALRTERGDGKGVGRREPRGVPHRGPETRLGGHPGPDRAPQRSGH
jgi:hypothetical protein